MVDNYLKKRIFIDLAKNSFIDFMVDENKASYESRFMLVFEKTTKSLTTVAGTSNIETDKTGFGSFRIFPNPVKDRTIKIHYSKIPVGRYNIHLISQTGQILYYSQLLINQPEGMQVIKLNKKITSGNYQLLISDENRMKFLQQIIF